jgi:deoxyribose-phosphate aldolase
MITDINLSRQLLSLIDLTSLNETDTVATIVTLCQKALMSQPHVAAVCVYPQFVKEAVTQLAGCPVKVATVANFPHGTDSLETVLRSIEQSIHDGADEIDVVFPYQAYLAGQQTAAQSFVQACKQACGHSVLLKVILETGALQDPQVIADACRDVILAGADFVKTSTGKIAVGATVDAAAIMLQTIKSLSSSVARSVGFKAAGGVRTIEQASDYINLANKIMGSQWATPVTFRIGASQLFDKLIAE